MSKEQLIHIFDESACLTRRQMKDYVKGGMTNEESHAIEVHLNACPFCNDAIEGLFAQQEGNAVEMIATLDSDFLKDHMGRNNPKVHLNSVAANSGTQYAHKRKPKTNVTAFWRNTSIAAILLLAIGLLWFLKFGNDTRQGNTQLAQQTEQQPMVADQQPPVNITIDKTTTTNAGQTPDADKKEHTAATTGNMPVAPAPQAKQEMAAIAKADIPAGKAERDNATNEKQKKELAEKDAAIVQNKQLQADKRTNATSQQQVERMATRTTQNVAATPPAVYTSDSKGALNNAKTEDVSYTIDGVSTRSASSIAKDNIAKADALFEKGQYEIALRVYKRELDSEEKDLRQKAMIGAAQCHNKLGDTSRAKELLQSVISEGGPQKKAAKKLLKELEASK